MLPALRERLLAVDHALARYPDASAAVAVILRERDGLEVLVEERAARAEDPWSGQWALPGGRRHRGETLLETAHRETEEEVGLSLRSSELLGCMEARSPGNVPSLSVLPFVFRWDGAGEPRTSPEAASIAWASLDQMPRTRTAVTVRVRGHELADVPAFAEGRRTIWGFTYRLLEDLLPLLRQ